MPKITSFRRILLLAAVILAPLATVAPAQQQGGEVASGRQILFVLDASGSMTAKLPGGGTRMEAAQAALIDMVQKLPASTSVALRVYGHTSPPSAKNCNDTELVMGFAPASTQKDVIHSKVMGLKALGYTPISRSLERAAKDFDGQPKGPRTVILVSDGRETCKADPCAVAAALAKADADLVVHTIGFGVDDVARGQLQCIARVARGSYFDAGTRGQLSDRLAEVAKLPPPPKPAEVARPAPSPAPQQEQARPAPTPRPAIGRLFVPGHKRDGGSMIVNSISGKGALFSGEKLELEPGVYTLKLKNGDWSGIEIKAGETTEIRPAFLKVTNPQTVFQLFDPETLERVFEVGFVTGAEPLVPGRYVARTLAGFSWPDQIELKSGETSVLKAALLRIRDDSIPAGWFLGVSIASGDHKTDHPFSHGAHGLPLPAGRYELRFTSAPQVAPVVIDLKEEEMREIAPVTLGTIKFVGFGSADNIAVHEATTGKLITFWRANEMQFVTGLYYLIINGNRGERFEVRPGYTTEIARGR